MYVFGFLLGTCVAYLIHTRWETENENTKVTVAFVAGIAVWLAVILWTEATGIGSNS